MKEQEIEVEVSVPESDPILTIHEAEIAAKLEEEVLEIVDEGLLQRALVHGGAGRKPQELEHVRVADERARSLIDATGSRQREYGVSLGG